HVSAWCLPRLMARRTLAGAVYAGVGVGIVVAGALCAALMAWRAASSEAWIVLGAVSLLATLLIWNVFSPSGSAGRGRETREWNAQWWPLVLCYGAFGFGYIIPATFLPVMARGELADPALFGWAWPAFGAAAAASTVLTAMYSNHVSHRLSWALAQLVMALGVGAPLAVHGLAGILITALCVGGSFMVVTITGLQEALQVAAAQAYSPQALERFEAAPPLALQLSPSGMRELDELHGVDMFGGKRRVDPFERSLEQRPQAWMLFGRLGVINYQNQLDPDGGSGGQFTLKRSGPSIGGTRISFGLRRRF